MMLMVLVLPLPPPPWKHACISIQASTQRPTLPLLLLPGRRTPALPRLLLRSAPRSGARKEVGI
jgi:hypothetical protein